MSEFLLTFNRANGQVLELSNLEARDPTTQATEPLGAGANVRATVYTKRDGLPIAGLTSLAFTYRSAGEFYYVLDGTELSDEADRYEVEAHGDDGLGSPFSWRRPLTVKTRRNGEPRATGAIAAAATWEDDPGIELLVFAEDQTAGSQTVVARVGPNGWLGDSAGDTTNDPTLNLTTPERWVFGQVAGRGISFGDVLGDVLNDPAGFTIVESVELASLPGQVNVWRKQNLTTFHGASLLLTNDGNPSGLRIDADYFYATGFTPRDQTTAPAAADRIPIGRSLIAHSVDPTLPRASRYGIWKNGVAAASVTVVSAGAAPGLTLDVAGSSFRWGGPRFSVVPPQAMGVFVVTRGIMTPKWHAALYADMVARGWT